MEGSGEVVETRAPGERGWRLLILAILAFMLLPTWIPPLRASLPIDDTMLLVVPALAACSLVGWWAGGRAMLAIVWVVAAIIFAAPHTVDSLLRSAAGSGAASNVAAVAPPDAYFNLARGWSLLLAGSFGLVCLFGNRGSFFPRALLALGMALGLAFIMSAIGPVGPADALDTLSSELQRRNTETMVQLNDEIGEHDQAWRELTEKFPQVASYPAVFEASLKVASTAGLSVFPALLALESLAALALAWAVYHRLGRARLGAPLGRLRDFRFNDQLVWGLIVGFTIVFLPTLSAFRGFGRNLLVFLGALYAVRGLGVLTWFLSPGVITQTVLVVLAVLLWPIAQAIAPYMALATFGLGLGDTWADWRKPRARPTS